jgi:hypothetical protein
VSPPTLEDELRGILREFLTAMATVTEDTNKSAVLSNATVLRACELCDFDPRLLYREEELSDAKR